jgi:hypothetical protein
MNLYEITGEYQKALDNLCDPETGEVLEASLISLNEIQKSFEDKCIAVSYFIENMEAEKSAIADVKKRMHERESRLNKKIQSLKDYLLCNMEKSDIKKINCPYFDISLQKNPPSVNILDEEAIPLEYKKIELKIDTALIRQDLLNNKKVDGAELIQRKSVRIK